VPFIRQTRDKRGFDHTYVMHVYHPAGGGPQRPRVLYVFRSPANLKVGRTALDAEVMEALEHTHPDLSFDWASLTRDSAATRVDHTAERPVRRPAPRGERPDRRPPPPAAPLATPDGSVLGRALGAAEAARLRQRYSALLQRIARRARTPDERARLIDRAARLNPDEWPDEATVRAQAPGVEAGWNAIHVELPSRRRGRRGGRRDGQPASGIMTGEPPGTGEAADDDDETTLGGGAGGGLGRAVGTAGAAGEAGPAADSGPEDLPPGD
jgi:hypothetical protein